MPGFAATSRPGARRRDSSDYPVLLIGWRSRTVGVVEALGSDVTCVICSDDLPRARSEAVAARLVVVRDPRAAEDVLAGLARAGLSLDRFVAVGSNFEYTMVSASIVGTIAGARCIEPMSAIVLRDKALQKAAIRAAGLATTDFNVVLGSDALHSAIDGYPVVVKPLSGAGTADTFVVASERDLSTIVGAARNGSYAGPWIVEHFVDGHELQIDGVVRDGVVLAFCVSRYLQNVISIKTGGVVGAVLLDHRSNARLYERAGDFARRTLQALGLVDGVFHLEVFEQADELVFGECAGRTSGGMVRDMIQYKHRYDIVDEWARALLGKQSAIIAHDDGFVYGDIQLSVGPGRVEAAPTRDDVLALSGVVDAIVNVKLGDDAPDPRLTSSVSSARAFVRGESESEVVDKLDALRTWFGRECVVAR